MNKSINVYLCFPYSHRWRIVRWWRFFKSIRLTARMMKQGYIVFSPITHSHPPSLLLGNSLSHDFWLKHDFSFLDTWADIVAIPFEEKAWEKSKGIDMEIDRFMSLGKPICAVGNDGKLIK